jgi:hypothetical protein
MATRTRFEGTTNLKDAVDVRAKAALMSDDQLSFFFKVTKPNASNHPLDVNLLAVAHNVFKDEMAARVLDDLADANREAAAALRAGLVK